MCGHSSAFSPRQDACSGRVDGGHHVHACNQPPLRSISPKARKTLKGFHHPSGSQQAFVTGLAHLYNLVPYQRRAQHAGQCGVEVEGGRLPTADWLLNLQILISGGFR
jgi:hypothetical protein